MNYLTTRKDKCFSQNMNCTIHMQEMGHFLCMGTPCDLKKLCLWVLENSLQRTLNNNGLLLAV